MEAPGDGRIHAIGHGESAEQPGAAWLAIWGGGRGAGLGPDFDDAINIALDCRVGGFAFELELQIHRHCLAQVGEAGVHFRRDAARPRTRPGIGWPELRVLFGEVFHDCEAIPYLESINMQAGHSGIAGNGAQGWVVVAPGYRDHVLGEGNAQIFKQEPWPQ